MRNEVINAPIATCESGQSWPKPGEVWSLWDMIASDKIARLAKALEIIGFIRGWIERYEDKDDVAGDIDLTNITHRMCEFGLSLDADLSPVTVLAMRELLPFQESVTYRSIAQSLTEICNTLNREMQSTYYFALSRSSANLFDTQRAVFGDLVEEKFPDSRMDFEEAAKCLALHRNTACVFHLMRGMEDAVSVLASSVGAVTKSEKRGGERLPWGSMVGNIKSKIDEMPQSLKKDEWLGVHAMLHSVNRAFRTKTAHPAKSYTVEQAESAYNAVKGFMLEMAELT